MIPVHDAIAPLLSRRQGHFGELDLDGLRPAALRVSRLAEALFKADESNVVVVHETQVWRAKDSKFHVDDLAAVRHHKGFGAECLWIEDTKDDPEWSAHPMAQGEKAIRFFAAAPVRLRGGLHLGALKVLSRTPRAFDGELVERLRDLANIFADECDRMVRYEARMMRDLFEQTPGFMAVFSGPDHAHDLFNAAYIGLMGPRPAVGMPLCQVAPELTGSAFVRKLDEVARTGNPQMSQGFSLTLERTDGRPETAYIDFVLQPIFNTAGAVTSIMLQGNDVSVERRAMAELRASRKQLEDALETNQALLDHSLDVICFIDAEGRFTNVSNRALDMWGYQPKELVGRHLLELVHREDRQATLTMAEATRAGQLTKAFQNRMLHRDGSAIPIVWSAAWSDRHQTAIAVARDMREAVAAENALRRAQKMEAVGRLTGGVAHDFNNLLTIVIGGAEALTEILPPESEAVEIARATLEAGERGADLVSRLLTFAKGQTLDPKRIEVEALFDTMKPLVDRTIGENIEVTWTRGGRLACRADQPQLESALLNLAINARHAMPDGGRLYIRADATTVTEKTARTTSMSPGAYVRFTVSDTGCGMDAKTLERAMEPFFTTKDVGKGSGLGLAMVYGFAQQSGGGVRMRSQVGKGTKVEIYLPQVVADAVDLAARSPDAKTAPAPGTGKILVVEDQDAVRVQVVRMLRALGYDVVESENGAKALEILYTHSDIDLMFTDIVMPGRMNGRQLAEHARLIHPNLKVLFTTGYTDDEAVQADFVNAPGDLIRKPYRRAELIAHITGAFESQSAAPAAA